KVEGLDHRQVPPELRTLAKDNTYSAYVLEPIKPRRSAHNSDLAGFGNENAGEDFDRGRFSGAIRADVTNQFSTLDRETDDIERSDLLDSAPHQAPDATPQSGLAARNMERLGQIFDNNVQHGDWYYEWRC